MAGANPNLSTVQFAQPASPAFEKQSARPSPLPYSNNTRTSTQAAAAWRQPGDRVMSLGKATFGSTFRPFD